MSPSIQFFFPPQVTPTDEGRNSPNVIVDAEAMNWKPRQAYEVSNIGDLVAGPKAVMVTGRIVNVHQLPHTSKRPRAAKGLVRATLRDDTGALLIKLYYVDRVYELHLGQLCTVWTPHVSIGDTSSVTPSIFQFTSIFPERDRSCFLLEQGQVDDGSRCKKPLGYQPGQPLQYLMSLREFIEGGYDMTESKILVCIKSIGPRKTYTNKNGKVVQKVDVGILDNASESSLALWGLVTVSTVDWKPLTTVLLISGPRWSSKSASVNLGSDTQVDVDPHMPEADWLRSYAARLMRKESIVQPFPVDVFEVDAPLKSANRVLFTFQELEEFSRANPGEKCTGFLSVIIIEMNLISLRQNHQLLCAECCGVPLYANATTSRCKNCEMEVKLELNPRMIGAMIDETGCLSGAQCIWSSLAFEQVLGRTAAELVDKDICDSNMIRDLQHYILFLRYTLAFGWDREVGKLVICQVMQ